MSDNKIIQNASETCFVLGGDLVASEVVEARSAIKQLIQGGVSDLVIDFTHVQMVDSLGIGCLVAVYNTLAKSGGKLTVSNVCDDVFALFQSMRLDHHFVVLRSA